MLSYHSLACLLISRHLWAGALPFRTCAFSLQTYSKLHCRFASILDLSKKNNANQLNRGLRAGAYIANLIARPF